MTELERRVARAIDPNAWERRARDSANLAHVKTLRKLSITKARAALKAHVEWLCSRITSMDQDNAASSVTVYFDEPEHSSEFFEALSAARQEEQHHD